MYNQSARSIDMEIAYFGDINVYKVKNYKVDLIVNALQIVIDTD